MHGQLFCSILNTAIPERAAENNEIVTVLPPDDLIVNVSVADEGADLSNV